jgi:hypothetical protein
VTTLTAHRPSSVNASRLVAIVVLLVAVLAASIALSSRHVTADAGASQSLTNHSVTPTTGNLTRAQAVAHALRVDGAGSSAASSGPVRPTVVPSVPANRYGSKLESMDAHGTS